MKFAKILLLLMLTICRQVAFCAPADDLGSLSGVVHNHEGAPLRGARVTIHSGPIQDVKMAITDSSGVYRFAGLPFGDYTVAAAYEGYEPTAQILVRIVSQSMPVSADLIMERNPSEAGAATPLNPPIEFQTSGIRGLIDPGGYSASTGTAATRVLRGIADLKRTDGKFSAAVAKEWPCDLETTLSDAVSQHPALAEVYKRLGQFYSAHDEPLKAIPLLNQALVIAPDDNGAARALAIAFLESGDFERARTLLLHLTERNNLPETHQLLARAYEGLGLFEKAGQEYGIAANNEPSEENRFGQAYELILSGSIANAATVLETAVRQFPRSIPLRIGAGTARFFLGDSPNALESFLDAIDIDPTDPRPYPFLAAAGDRSPNEALRVKDVFKRYLSLEPNSASANYFYALVLSRESAGPYRTRIENLLKHAVELDPNFALAHLLLADTYVQLDDYKSAVPEYEPALRSETDLNDAHYRLAVAYRHTGSADRSAREMQIFRTAKQRQSQNVTGINVSQFISVMNANDQRSVQEIRCPAAAH